MSFEDVYLVSSKLDLLGTERFEPIAAQLGDLPIGYVEFLAELGTGTFCDYLTVWSPEESNKRSKEFREIADDLLSDFSEFGSEPVPRLDFCNAQCIAGTVDGDYLVVCPDAPTDIYAFPRNDDSIYILPNGFYEPLGWIRLNKPERDYTIPPPFKYFESDVNRAYAWFLSDGSLPFQDAVTVVSTFEKPSKQFSGGGESNGSDHFVRVFLNDLYGQVYLSQSENDPRVQMMINFDRDFESKVAELQAILSDNGFRVTHSLS